MDLQVYFPFPEVLLKYESIDESNFKDFLDEIKVVPNRSISFFDEVLSGYILVKNNSKSILDLKSFNKLIHDATNITIELHIQQTEFGKANLERLHLRTIILSKSMLMYNGNCIGPDGNYIAIYKFDLPITYPKKKLINPKIIITIIMDMQRQLLDINENKENSKDGDESIILPNYTPVERRNLLSGLVSQTFEDNNDEDDDEDDAVVENKQKKINFPKISESLILPENSNLDIKEKKLPKHPTVLIAKYSLPVYPTLTMKLKCTKHSGQLNTDRCLLSTLDLSSSKELSKIKHLSFEVLKIELKLKDGQVENLITDSILNNDKNLIFKKNDNFNISYKLKLNSTLDQNDLIKPLTINIVSQPRQYDPINKKFINLTNILTTNWITNVDFSISSPSPINKLLQSKKLGQRQLHQKSKNFSLTNLTQHQENINTSKNNQRLYELKKSLRTVSQAVPISSLTPSNGSLSNSPLPQSAQLSSPTMISPLTGLQLTISSKNNVKFGELFKWNFQLINTSSRQLNLVILMDNDSYLNESIFEKSVPRLPITPSAGSYSAKSNSNISLVKNSSIASNNDIPNFIQPQFQLIRNYNMNRLSCLGIISTTNDIKVSPLDPFSCIDVDIELMAIEKGVFTLNGVKIIDMYTGESFDLGRLLEVVVN
ncbi:hypothetical protein PACTADRAFT_1433 [Pachysolen tannophilus NRRL Y-2460]|uniref:Trafficking protein particle complex II-specific subunit 65 IgD3 domain-containing protein n=1 Tax=Pachysolen tannophilus NRRL Y-2460 TaxID=669874 RepID=A0A1E4TYN0_PACTA|nr:hypothetical protein PACTADRAFT_1433 [Pachysolen tannophilus NRRL Y-2460]